MGPESDLLVPFRRFFSNPRAGYRPELFLRSPVENVTVQKDRILLIVERLGIFDISKRFLVTRAYLCWHN